METKRTALSLVVITLLCLLAVGVVGVIGVTGFANAADGLKQHIIVQLQIPLILTACLVGAALSVSGATLQVVLRNPLADPGIIGITSGASLVAALLLLLTPQWATAYLHYLLPFGCFVGALLSTFVIYRLARKLLGSSTAVILAGIAISTLSGAVIAWLYMFSDANALRNLTFWLMGSLYQTNWLILSVGGPLIVIAVGLQLFFAGDLNKLYAGELAAKSSGVDVERLTERALIVCAIAVGTAVSMAGSIAFVGLLVPHILRLIIGHNNRFLLPLSALSGASLLMLVALSSEMTRAITLPVSMVTATLGGPLLIWALAKGQLKG
ncbi:FecCD family ABC transporter permease [Alteromonas macleodii]|uniref:Heme ABC transporter permease n=1 Tax=Alteromonas macleodii TaxID=28108 RepID=A0A6T9XXJ3_ALTMA|nr:iron ABC transporter permease [Alteromonas macleodii]CAB9493334.1 Heme ABC transporter permease [Alteromonas macleodii]